MWGRPAIVLLAFVCIYFPLVLLLLPCFEFDVHGTTLIQLESVIIVGFVHCLQHARIEWALEAFWDGSNPFNVAQHTRKHACLDKDSLDLEYW